MKSLVVIPTYNEAKNIIRLLDSILALDVNLDILVVDDNSPDKTFDAVNHYKQNHHQINLLLRPQKQGLGPAYVAGFKYALANSYDLICTMDADWSHDPKYLPKLIEAAKKYDLVLGSRYVLGGGTRNWSWLRRIISRYGNWYARFILGLSFHDITGGFKCYRRKVLEAINLDRLASVGYNFQIETTYRAFRQGFKIVEVPIIFFERHQGSSKFNLKIILESFWRVLQLRVRP